jgi:hypothetical protein
MQSMHHHLPPFWKGNHESMTHYLPLNSGPSHLLNNCGFCPCHSFFSHFACITISSSRFLPLARHASLNMKSSVPSIFFLIFGKDFVLILTFIFLITNAKKLKLYFFFRKGLRCVTNCVKFIVHIAYTPKQNLSLNFYNYSSTIHKILSF